MTPDQQTNDETFPEDINPYAISNFLEAGYPREGFMLSYSVVEDGVQHESRINSYNIQIASPNRNFLLDLRLIPQRRSMDINLYTPKLSSEFGSVEKMALVDGIPIDLAIPFGVNMGRIDEIRFNTWKTVKEVVFIKHSPDGQDMEVHVSSDGRYSVITKDTKAQNS